MAASRWALQRDERGAPVAILETNNDITERKRAEDALQRAYDELEKRVENRTAALAEANRNLEKEVAERRKIAEELQTSSERLKMFAYSIAHDLKSPSVGIYGLTRLLKKHLQGILDEKGAGFCEQIMKTSEHVASLVDAINLFIATKETPLKIEEINMEEIFHTLRDEFSARLRVRNIELLQPNPIPPVRADKICLLRVFRNLIDNAIKYGGDGLTTIEIGYEKSENFHHLKVKDDGVGVQADESIDIFKLFQRQSASDNVEGAGLGLAIVKEIVELHKGKVRVDSGKEGGTVFHLFVSSDL